ncbi:MAG: LON peptidase substrate-binding domain-containing protein, partial [Anaerolineae bacterium]|nr:LON peptidase substrate-binding domain-containing protein [Anaerolineae bacterium]
MDMTAMDSFESDHSPDVDFDEELILPLLPVRDTVVFPRMLTPLFIGRERSIQALEAAMADKGVMIVATQRNAEMEDPEPEDLFPVGTEVSIGRMLKMPDGGTNILAQGQQRIEILGYVQHNPFPIVRARRIKEITEQGPSSDALMRAVLALFEKCVHLNRNIPDDAYVAAMNIDEPGWLADMIASVMELEIELRQQ